MELRGATSNASALGAYTIPSLSVRSMKNVIQASCLGRSLHKTQHFEPSRGRPPCESASFVLLYCVHGVFMAYNPQNLHACEKEKKHVKRATIDTIMTVVGLIASVSSIPQALKIYQTGDVSGISLLT